MDGPGPLSGAPIFSVFPKNHYKKLVFGGPNHSQRVPLSQAVILVWGHILGMLPKLSFDENIKIHKNEDNKNIKNTAETWSLAPGTSSIRTSTKKKQIAKFSSKSVRF